MRTTELIDLMMNLVIYPCLVILHAIVAQSLVHIFLTKPVNNLWKEHTNQHIQMVNVNLRFSLLLTKEYLESYLYLLKVDHYTPFGPTWNISNLQFLTEEGIKQLHEITNSINWNKFNLICLKGHLNRLVVCYQRQLQMEACKLRMSRCSNQEVIHKQLCYANHKGKDYCNQTWVCNCL